MYAKEENNEIVKYNKLPKIFDAAKDEHITLTADNCGAYGFKPLVQPTYNSRTHKRTTNIIADGANYTFEVVSLNKTLAQLKKELLLELQGYRRAAFDEGKHHHDYLKDTRRESELNSLKTKIGEFYQIHETTRAQIEALTTIEDAANYTLPMTDINAALTYLRELV